MNVAWINSPHVNECGEQENVQSLGFSVKKYGTQHSKLPEYQPYIDWRRDIRLQSMCFVYDPLQAWLPILCISVYVVCPP